MPSVNKMAPTERTITATLALEGFPADPEKPNGPVEQLTVTYKPSSVTLANDRPTDGESVDDPKTQYGMAERLCEICVEWDLDGPAYRDVVELDGTRRSVETLPAGPIPLVPEKVANVEFSILKAIYQAIVTYEASDPKQRRKRS